MIFVTIFRKYGWLMVWLLALSCARAQWIKTGAGPYYYDDSVNWLGGVVNGKFTNSVGTGQTVVFRDGVTLASGTSLYLTLNATAGNILFKGENLSAPLRLNGSVVTALRNGSRLFTFGSMTAGSALDINLGAADRVFNISVGDTVQLLNTVSSDGTFGIIKQGSGSLELWDVKNNFSGAIQVQAGVLIFSSMGKIGETSALGKPLTASNGTIKLGGGSSTSVQLQFGGTNGEVPGDSVSDRAICWLGTEGTYTLENQSGFKWVLSADFQNQATGSTPAQLAISGKNGSVTEIDGVLGDVGSGRKTSLSANGQSGAGTPFVLRLSGTMNTFSGAVSTGYNTILEVTKLANRGSASSLGTGVDNPLITVGGTGSTYGSTLRYIGENDSSTDRPINLQFRSFSSDVIENNSPTNANLNFSNTSTWTILKAGTAGNNTLSLQGTSTGTSTIAGRIVDEGLNSTNKTSLMVSSSGVWRLTNESSFSGSTTLTAGTLLIDGTLSKTAALTVSGGTLGGNGLINTAATVKVASGAGLAPGGDATIGQLTLGTLIMQNGSVLDIDLNSDQNLADLLWAKGSISLGTCTLNLRDLSATRLEQGTSFLILHSDLALSGTFANQTLQAGLNQFALDYSPRELRLVVIPEPAACGLLFTGLAGLVIVYSIKLRTKERGKASVDLR